MTSMLRMIRETHPIEYVIDFCFVFSREFNTKIDQFRLHSALLRFHFVRVLNLISRFE